MLPGVLGGEGGEVGRGVGLGDLGAGAAVGFLDRAGEELGGVRFGVWVRVEVGLGGLFGLLLVADEGERCEPRIGVLVLDL